MESKKSFAHTSARISLWLALGAVMLFVVAFLGRLLPIYMPAAYSTALVSLVGSGMLVSLLLSVVCGFIALSGVKQHGRDGVIVPAAIGLSLSALMLIPMLYGVGLAIGARVRGAQARDTPSSKTESPRGQDVPVVVTASASASGNFIPAAHCADVVHDAASDILYITAADQLLRYRLGSNAWMTSLNLGGSLAGIDLSPDGRTLAVADRMQAGGQVWIHLFDLRTGTNEKVLFPRASMEGGTYSVAFGSDGAVYVTSTFEGSGTVPLRRYDPVARNSSLLRTVNQDTMLQASASRHVIAFAEANTSAGTYGLYDVRAGKVSFESRADRFLWEIAASRDGTQLAIPTHRDTLIHGPNPRAIGSAADGRPIGAVFHPTRDIAFFAWSGSTTLRVWDTQRWRELDRIDVGVPIEPTGNRAFRQGRMKMSLDGSVLFCTVSGGVCHVRPRLKPAADVLSADRR